MNITWTTQTGKYSNGEDCKLGEWVVGSVSWNGVDRNPDLRYVAYCKLPGIKDVIGKFPTEQEAKSKLEATIAYWLKNI